MKHSRNFITRAFPLLVSRTLSKCERLTATDFSSDFSKTAKSNESLICSGVQSCCSANQEKDLNYYLVDFQRILVTVAC